MTSGPPYCTSGTRVLAIVGPTASGKSAIAEEIALRRGGEIVSADSMQVYRGMDVGTAKMPPSGRRVPHHCIDIVDPGTEYSAALFQGCARASIASIAARGLLPIVAGGTGMYVRAALDDWEFPTGGEVHSDSRRAWEELAEREGPEALHLYLKERDPEAAAIIHPNNVRRVVRALEMLESGVSYASQHEAFSDRTSIYDTRLVGLSWDRDALYTRIGERVDRMLDEGLVDEVSRLLDAGFREAVTAQAAIGYKELVPVIEQGASLDEAVESIKRASRRYAKRQMTWFRADPRVTWVDVTGLSAMTATDAVEAAIHFD